MWPSESVTVLRRPVPSWSFLKGRLYWFIGELQLVSLLERRFRLLLHSVRVIVSGRTYPTLNSRMYSFQNSVSGRRFCSQESSCDWLMLIAWWLWPVKNSQWGTNSCMGRWNDTPARHWSRYFRLYLEGRKTKSAHNRASQVITTPMFTVNEAC
jgi:hypothetical protein